MPGPSMPIVDSLKPFLTMLARFCLSVAWYITNIWRRNPVESSSVKTGLLLNSLDGTGFAGAGAGVFDGPDPILNLKGCVAALSCQES